VKTIVLGPYVWQGPYARMRSSKPGFEHQAGLCATVRAPWMEKDDRIILRTSEIVGYEEDFLYDDHFPHVAERRGRGKRYRHIPFEWNAQDAPHALCADCRVPDKGAFSLKLLAGEDAVDIELGIRNGLSSEMVNIDWSFCVVGFDSPSIGDAQLERTYLFDGERLRSLRDLTGEARCELFPVAGCGGYMPAMHKDNAKGSVEAQASVVIVESVDGKYGRRGRCS